MAKTTKTTEVTILAFIAISSSSSARIKTFPVSPGFGPDQPRANLDTFLSDNDDWTGFAAVTDGKKLAVRRLYKARDAD